MRHNIFDYAVLIYFMVRSLFFNIFFSKILSFSKQDTCISIILGIIISIPILLIYNKVKDNKIDSFTKNKSIFKYYKIANSLIIITTLMLATYLFWNMTNFVSVHLLYDTPKIIIIIFFVIPIIYTLFKDIEALYRGKVIMFYISILMFTLSYIFLIPNIKLNNFMPIFYNSNILISTMFYVIYIVLPFYTLSIFPKNTIKNFTIKKIITYNILFEIVIFIVSFNVISIYGVNLSLFLNIPEYHLLKKISFAETLNRIDTILSIQWLFDYFVTITFFIYYLLRGLITTFKVNYKISLIIIITIIAFITNILNYNIINILFLYILPTFIVISYFIIPLIALKKGHSPLYKVYNNEYASSNHE